MLKVSIYYVKTLKTTNFNFDSTISTIRNPITTPTNANTAATTATTNTNNNNSKNNNNTPTTTHAAHTTTTTTTTTKFVR